MYYDEKLGVAITATLSFALFLDIFGGKMADIKLKWADGTRRDTAKEQSDKRVEIERRTKLEMDEVTMSAMDILSENGAYTPKSDNIRPIIHELDEEKDREIINSWYEKAAEQTFETLPGFISQVINGYCHDYGTICHAISACSLATAWACNRMDGACGGITGFQAGAIMWMFIKHWEFKNNKCGLRLINYDDMLYPQYEYRFNKSIDSDIWEKLQEEAKKLIEETKDAPFGPHPEVLAHWKSIAEGHVPFGLEVKDD